MPLPTSINDLSTTVGSNSPAGSENPQTFDDYLRWHASFIAALRDVALSGTANLSTANLTYTGTLTGSTGVLNIGAGQLYKDASGNVGVGTTGPSSYGKFAVVGTGDLAHLDATSGAVGITLYENGAGRARIRSLNGSAGLAFLAGLTEAMRIDASGNQINAPSNTPPTLTVNGQMNLTPTSDTNVRISYRGSDGTTRVANITLA